MKDDVTEKAGKPDLAALNKTIERAKQELEHMIDLNPQIMLLVDRQGKTVRANRALLEMLGRPDFKKVLGKSLHDLFPCEEKSFFPALLTSKGGYDVKEIKVVLGSRRHRLLRFAVVSSSNEVSVIIVNDVTSEKEQAFHRERKYKKEAVQALMGGLMHNVNQPLTVIMVQAQFMQLALEKGLARPEEMKDDLQNIMSMTMQVSEMLKTVEKPRAFVTEHYIDGLDILDLRRSGTSAGPNESFGPAALDVLVTALDIHDPGARLHARRTSNYAGILATHMGLDAKECGIVRRCAYFHDIGKIGIPDLILQKPEGLSEKEMAIMHSHTETGYKLLSTFPLLRDEAETAFSHHEHCDGKGYPRNLKRKKISVYSRITAVADAFDALSVNRTYHHGAPLDLVMATLRQGSGTQFDAGIIDILNKCVDEFQAGQGEA